MTVVPDGGIREGDFIPGKDLARVVDESGEVGFGLVPIKAEGTSVPYDPGVRLFSAEHPKALKDGLNKMFGEVYEDLDPDNFEDLWIDIDDQNEA